MMKIAIVYDKKQPYTTGIYCRNALKALGHKVRLYGIKSRIFLPYDLVLKIDDGTSSGLNVMPWHKTAFWAIDTHTDMNRLLKIAQRSDFLFSAQKEGVNLFEEEGYKSLWLPLAGEKEVSSEDSGKYQDKFDLSFIGGVHTEKRKRLKALFRNSFPSKNIFFGPANRQDISPIYSISYIGLNSIVNNDINMRTFEVTINGALLLTEKIYNNGMEELFVEGKEYIAYEGEEDLVNKINRLFHKKGEYNLIRRAGHNRALNEHTYLKRMSILLESITHN